MPFKPPQWAPTLQEEVPDTISVADFMLDEEHGRRALKDSKPPFVCGVSGEALSASAVKERVELLASGLAKELEWKVDQGGPLDKVICLFSLNTIDYLPLIWAVHRLGGVVTPAAAAAGIPRHRVYLLELPSALAAGAETADFKSTSQLVQLGARLSRPEALKWNKSEGKRQIAMLCYSSGTSGLPKGVMDIALQMQVCAFEKVSRDRIDKGPSDEAYMENVLGLLPLSHIYGLVIIAHCAIWRDSVIILPKFELKQCLRAIQDYKINTLFLVPPIIILMIKNPQIMSQYNLGSVRAIFTGAAPLGHETAEQIAKLYPTWLMRQAYGLTETCAVVSSSADFDIWLGSAGCFVTGVEGRVISLEGTEITECGRLGELWVKSPSLVLGYLNNEKANSETFITDEHGDRWMRTGDEVAIKKGPNGHEHLFIMDRIKELIKVNGLQVAPAELEAHLLLSPYVADCAVVGIPDDNAGEVPKAYVVKSPSPCYDKSDEDIRHIILKHVQQHKSRHKWLRGGVEFLGAVPKSPTGKILRRLLREKGQEEGQRRQEKL